MSKYDPVKALIDSAKRTREEKENAIEQEKRYNRQHNWRVAIVSSIIGAIIGAIITYALAEIV